MIIWVITGVFELLLLITISGVLFSLAALFSLLELMLISINPLCLYLVRQSGQLFTCLIGLMKRRAQHILRKMCPTSSNEQMQEPMVATIEPLSSEMKTYVTHFEVPLPNNLIDLQENPEEEVNNDDERSPQIDEITSNTAFRDDELNAL